MIIYVDDFKLSGPREHLQKGWDLLQEPSVLVPGGIDIEPPEEVGRFLSCQHVITEREITWQGENPTDLDPPEPKAKKTMPWAAPAEPQCAPCEPATFQNSRPVAFEIPQKRTVKVMEYDMRGFFESSIELYAELTDTDPANYPAVATPFGVEHTDIEDGQGGPRGEVSSPSMEALAELL